MSKDTKDIKDTFHSELEKATLKELQEAITWRLCDIQKSRETMHGPFKYICRSGANPEKTLRICGGAMQVYHHNQ